MILYLKRRYYPTNLQVIIGAAALTFFIFFRADSLCTRCTIIGLDQKTGQKVDTDQVTNIVKDVPFCSLIFFIVF